MKRDTLIQALNREVTTFLRYMLQAASIKGAAHKPVRQMYLAEVADEVGHAQYLANQIRMLGGKPDLKPDLTTPPEDVPAMLVADVEQSGSTWRYTLSSVTRPRPPASTRSR